MNTSLYTDKSVSRIPIASNSTLKKPGERRKSSVQFAANNRLKEYSKRRSYSLKDNKNIMTTSIYLQEDELKMLQKDSDMQSIPEKDVSDKNIDSSLPSKNISNDSLDNIKVSSPIKKEGGTDSILETLQKSVPDKGKVKSEKPNELERKSSTFSKEKPEKQSAPVKKNNNATQIEELQKYYEGEMHILKKQLQQLSKDVQPNEDALMKKCASLESQLTKARNEKEAIEDQFNGLQVQLKTWPNKVTELEEENATLRARIEDVRTINHQRQNEIDELHEIVKNWETKFWEQSTGSQQQEKLFLQRLMHEYDNLLKDYEMMKLSNLTNERKLYETRNRFNELNIRISELEMDNAKIESENNFLKKRFNTEKAFESHRGWNRSSFPLPVSSFNDDFLPKQISSHEALNIPAEQSTKTSNTGMMSFSCYGALPSYGFSVPSTINESKPLETPVNPPGNMMINSDKGNTMMSQSMYTTPQIPAPITELPENSGSNTPTTSRRHITISDDSFRKTQSNYREEFMSSQHRNESPDNIHQNNRMATSMITTSTTPTNIFNNHNKSNMESEIPAFSYWNQDRTEDERELEKKYDQLHNEKRQLLTRLSHIPGTSSARNRRSNREQKENLETRLDQIDRQLGLLRMTLKKKNIL